MRPANLLRVICNLALAFYRTLSKLSINAHQLIAHWRSRINRKRSTVQPPASKRNYNRSTSPAKAVETSRIEPVESPSQSTGLSITTPNLRRLKFFSVLHRLSIRNFMEYCVIALNEASSSTYSNKFDLSSCDKPVWLLGRQYTLPRDVDKLVEDVKSKLWITYRRNFPPINDNTRYTTDRGFGCMIRCGQMVLANALLQKNLGREWRWLATGLEANPDVYIKILKLFQDKEDCPYSIHNIVRTGEQEGKLVGEWFGPNTIAQALKRMASALSLAKGVSDEVLISIDAALDNVVVVDETKACFRHGKSSNPNQSNTDSEKSSKRDSDTDSSSKRSVWTPGILFIQLRLGLTKINPLYFSALKKTFQFKNSLGIIGGRPNHALYLIGYTNDDIIYLDPHSTQQFVDLEKVPEVDERVCDELGGNLPADSTYHCACPEKMSIDRLDPSLALCFYFHTEQEFDDWCRLSSDLLIKSEQTPMFEITESRPSDWNIPLTSMAVNSCSADRSCKEKKADHNSNDDIHRFTILKEAAEQRSVDLELKTVNAELNQDDEEFEMLG